MYKVLVAHHVLHVHHVHAVSVRTNVHRWHVYTQRSNCTETVIEQTSCVDYVQRLECDYSEINYL